MDRLVIRANSAPSPRATCPACRRDVAWFQSKNAFRPHGKPLCIGSGMDINAKAEEQS